MKKAIQDIFFLLLILNFVLNVIIIAMIGFNLGIR